MLRLIIVGPRGKMGRLITQAAAEKEEIQLIGGVAPKGADYIGSDLGNVAMVGRELGVPVVEDLSLLIDECDCIIDFSTRENGMNVLALAMEHKKALVCGTTGFSPEEMQAFQNASKQIPMLYAANTSKLVNVMNLLLKIATELVGKETDIEILEMHDKWKKDAPSGTSKEMGETIAHVLGKELSELAVFGREGVSPREEGTIGYHSLRAGNIPSSHTVYFGGVGERLEITHHSYNWECFARGAVDCALFLEGKSAGYYTIKDVLKIS